jgi:hypothetical protein
MIEHLFSHFMGRKVESRIDDWVAAGRQSAPIANGGDHVLTFGRRVRIQILVVSIGMVGICCFAAWVHLAVERLGFWLLMGYLGVIAPAALISLILTIDVHTTRVELSESGLKFYRFGFILAELDWDSVTAVRRSQLTPSIIIETSAGRRVRVSTQLDGLQALAESLLRTSRPACDVSIVDWMIDDLLSGRSHTDTGDDPAS